jgi:hypothetical protein
MVQDGRRENVTFDLEARSVLKAACLEAYEMLEQLACGCGGHRSSSRQLEAGEAWRRIIAYMTTEKVGSD